MSKNEICRKFYNIGSRDIGVTSRRLPSETVLGFGEPYPTSQNDDLKIISSF